MINLLAEKAERTVGITLHHFATNLLLRFNAIAESQRFVP